MHLENGLPQKNKYRPFVPNPRQMKLAPSISGNTINGLNNKKVTRPKVIYWSTEPNSIPHGEMQKWFYTVDPGLPDFSQTTPKTLQKYRMYRSHLFQKNASKYTGGYLVKKVRKICQVTAFVIKIGVAEMDQAWVFDGYYSFSKSNYCDRCSARLRKY